MPQSHAMAVAAAGAAAGTLLALVLHRRRRAQRKAQLLEQAPGILYDTVAREWRCKVHSREGLGVAQQAWKDWARITSEIPGVVRVQRLCCGTCLDFRIVVSMRADAYPAWKERGHYPESEFLSSLRSSGCIEVCSQLLSIADA